MADKRIIDYTEAASAGADYYLVTDSASDGVKKIKPANILPAYTGDVTSTASGTVNTIAANAVTNAKAAQMAAGTIKANLTGALASASDNTINAVMDAAFGSTQGAVAYRGASGWSSLAPGTSGQFMQTSGPSANPIWQTIPGGGNMLSSTYDPTGKAADAFDSANTTFLQLGTGATPRSVQDKARDYVTVRDYGALCDGVTDDAAAINASIVATKTAIIPADVTCIVGSTINVPIGAALKGMSRQSSVIKASGSGYPVVTLSNNALGASIQNLFLDRAVTAAPGDYGIYQAGVADEIVIKNLNVRRQHVGMVLGNVAASWISECIISNCTGSGIQMSNNSAVSGEVQWHITDVGIFTCDGYGILATSNSGPAGLALGDWTLIKTYGNTQGGIFIIGSSAVPIYDMRLSNSFLGNDGNSGVYLDTYGSYHSITNVFIEQIGTSATGSSSTTPASGIGCGIQITANNSYTVISGGRAVGNSDNGVLTAGTATQINSFSAISNALSSPLPYNIYISGGDAIVTGSRLIASNYGLRVDVDNVTLVGNDLSGNTTAPALFGVAMVNSSLIGNRPSTIGNFLPNGLALANPTGGNQGPGSINVAAGMFKNNSAYNNP